MDCSLPVSLKSMSSTAQPLTNLKYWPLRADMVLFLLLMPQRKKIFNVKHLAFPTRYYGGKEERTQEMWVQSLGQEDPLEEEMGTPLQYSCLENPKDRGACWAVVHGVSKSWTWRSTHTSFALKLGCSTLSKCLLLFCKIVLKAK